MRYTTREALITVNAPIVSSLDQLNKLLEQLPYIPEASRYANRIGYARHLLSTVHEALVEEIHSTPDPVAIPSPSLN